MKRALLYLATFGIIICAPMRAELPGVSYAGGDGSSYEKAILLTAPDMKTGMLAEHSYIGKHFPGYQRGGQKMEQKDGKTFDVLEFTTAEGAKKTLYFDISSFADKW